MEITKRNFKKTLKELDLSVYPSLDDFLRNIRLKLISKTPLTVSEELMAFPKLKRYFDDYRRELNKYHVNQLNLAQFSHRPPRDFQEIGIRFLLLNDRCILADDMGVGKSIQSVLAALLLPEDYKILVVTMRSLKYNIEEEIKPYSNSYKVIEKKWESGYKFTIVHYEALKKFKKEILAEKYNCIISDEAHCLKNAKIGRTKNFMEVIKATEKVWLLTGTPINNRPSDFYNLLKIIHHPLSKNWLNYVEKYCDASKNHWGAWDISGASNLEELYEKTKGSILRRLKRDVIKDLPNKDRMPVYLHLDNKKEYDNVVNAYREMKMSDLDGELMEFINEDDFDIPTMTKFILWRQYCALKKTEDGSLVELVDTQIEAGNKIVVFTNFTKVVDTVYEKFGPDVCCFIDGRIKDAKERLEIVKRFNDSTELKVLVCNLKVGSVGLNITGANVAIINDMDWVPSTMLQAEDRLWRIGQKSEVTILYPIYKNTVEDIVFNVVNAKMRNISVAIEGKREEYFKNEKDLIESEVVATRKTLLQEIFSQLG